MSKNEMYENLCKKCYIKLCKPSKYEIKKMVMSEEPEKCDHCGRCTNIVEYIEDYD